MNYSKKGLRDKQAHINSKQQKWYRKLIISIVQVLLFVFVVGVVTAGAFAIGAFQGAIDTAPDITSDSVAPVGYSSFVYDSEGNQTAKLVTSNANRIPVTLEEVPEDLINAFVAIEDSRFYEHNGIDIMGIIRAGLTGVLNGFDFTSGASTITQQLIKNTVFEDFIFESTFDTIYRKIQEQYLAIQLTEELTKDEIMIRYLNTINLGQSTLGVQSASLRYFDKTVDELTLSECALIAGITKSPEGYNPIHNPEANAVRRKAVLDAMLSEGYITVAEYDEAMADDPYTRILAVNEIQIDSGVNSFFVDAVTDQVYDDLIEAGYSESQAYSLLYSGGIEIHTTQDPKVQAAMDSVLENEENFPDAEWELSYQVSITRENGDVEHFSSEMMMTFLSDHDDYKKSTKKSELVFSTQEEGQVAIDLYLDSILKEGDTILAENKQYVAQPQISMTIIDQETGQVVAMAGGRGEKTANKTLNRAVDTVRPPGSTFKTLSTFAPAIDMGTFTLASVQNDAPFYYSALDNGQRKLVQNHDRIHHGLTNYRKAITSSNNTVTVKALTVITPQVGMDYLLNFGFTSLLNGLDANGNNDVQQPLALGGITYGVSNLELTAAYASIANDGVYTEPTLYTLVLDRDGNILLDNTSPDTKRVLQESTAWLLTDSMEDVVTSGTGTRANFSSMDVAGKTGTTSDTYDLWFAGYTPYYTASVWVGYDNNTASLTGDNGRLHTNLWREVMEAVHVDLESAGFDSKPDSVVTAQVCRQSGKLPIAGVCTDVYTEYFAKGTVPTTSCDVHFSGIICSDDNVPATPYCPDQITGVLTRNPIEHESLWEGSISIVQQPDGSVIEVNPNANSTATECHHTFEYMSEHYWHTGIPPTVVPPTTP